PHATVVWATVAVEAPFEVLGGIEGYGAMAGTDSEDRQLGTRQALLDDDGATGMAERGTGELRLHVVLGIDQRLAHEHALAGRKPVGLHDVGRLHGAQELQGRSGVGESSIA